MISFENNKAIEDYYKITKLLGVPITVAEGEILTEKDMRATLASVERYNLKGKHIKNVIAMIS